MSASTRGLGAAVAVCVLVLPCQGALINPGQEITREISPGETHTYEMRAGAQQYVRFELDSKLSLIAKLALPSDETAVAIDDTRRHDMPITLTVVAPSGGLH